MTPSELQAVRERAKARVNTVMASQDRRALLSHIDEQAARIAELESKLRELAGECAECHGEPRGVPVYGRVGDGILYYKTCPDCADIRALLPEGEKVST